MNGDNMAPAKPKGPLLAIIVIIIILVVGGFYVMSQRGISTDEMLDENATSTMSTSTEITDIEADLNDTDITVIDAELNQLDKELSL